MGAEQLKERFQGITLEVEDLFLLEAFQIKAILHKAPKRELAAVLHAYSDILRFLITKNPPSSSFITEIMKEYGPALDQEQLNEFIDRLVWDEWMAFYLLRNKHPEEVDYQPRLVWFLEEITSITPLDDKVVIDVGAGTGNIAFDVVNSSRVVFALEPVTSLREFMRKKAKKEGTTNLFVIDGFLHEIPLPEDSVDVLITSNAITYGPFVDELEEIERIVKPDGYAIHLLIQSAEVFSNNKRIHQTLTSSKWNYQLEKKDWGIPELKQILKIDELSERRIYWKQSSRNYGWI